MTTTYIVIEVSEKENALDIMNTLMTHTKARFTITKNIGEYAAERDKLNGTSCKQKKEESFTGFETTDHTTESPTQNLLTSPQVTVREESPGIEEIDASTYYGIGQVVPKTEQQDYHPPEPYRQSNQIQNYQQEAVQKNGNFVLAHNIAQQDTSMNSSYNQYTLSDALAQTANSGSNYAAWGPPLEEAGTSGKSPTTGYRKRTKLPTGFPMRSSEFKCAICGTVIKAIGLDYAKRKNHAIVHMDVKRYACPIDGCDYASRHRSNITSHVRLHHKITTQLVVPDQLTEEQTNKLRLMVYQCFPEMKQPKGRGFKRGVKGSVELHEEEFNNVEEVEDQ